MANTPNPIREVIRQLGGYLQAQVPALQQVLYDWPDANIQLKMPTLAITSGKEDFTNLMPVALSSTAPDVNGYTTTTYCVGEYDFSLQLDLWCRNKEDRFTLYNSVFNALNAQLESSGCMGLSLQLTNYFNEWARYDFVTNNFSDDEESAQRQEWRAMLTVLANCKAILVGQPIYAMKTIAQQFDTPDTII